MPIYLNWGGDFDPPYPPKIKGAATDVDHPNWIELNSLQWGAPSKQRASDSAGDREGIINAADLIVTKRQDNTSNLLFRESNGGQPQTVIIDIKRGNNLLSIRLTGTLISNFLFTDRGKETTEILTLSYTKLKWGTKSGVTPHDTPPPGIFYDLAPQLGA